MASGPARSCTWGTIPSRGVRSDREFPAFFRRAFGVNVSQRERVTWSAGDLKMPERISIFRPLAVIVEPPPVSRSGHAMNRFS